MKTAAVRMEKRKYREKMLKRNTNRMLSQIGQEGWETRRVIEVSGVANGMNDETHWSRVPTFLKWWVQSGAWFRGSVGVFSSLGVSCFCGSEAQQKEDLDVAVISVLTLLKAQFMGDGSRVEHDGTRGSEPQGLTSERWEKEEKSAKETEKEQPAW